MGNFPQEYHGKPRVRK